MQHCFAMNFCCWSNAFSRKHHFRCFRGAQQIDECSAHFRRAKRVVDAKRRVERQLAATRANKQREPTNAKRPTSIINRPSPGPAAASRSCFALLLLLGHPRRVGIRSCGLAGRSWYSSLSMQKKGIAPVKRETVRGKGENMGQTAIGCESALPYW